MSADTVSGLQRTQCSSREVAMLPLWAEVLGAAVVLGAGLTIIYRLAATRAATQAMAVPWWLVTPVDRVVPVIPAAVWVYVSWYPAIALLAFGGRAAVRRAFIALAVAFVVCSIGYLLLPIYLARPIIQAGDGASAAFLVWFYAFDPPYNLFPSFHAAAAGVLAAAARRPGWRAAAVIWAAAVCASCVLIRQHYVLDVIVGLGIGLGAARVARRLRPEWSR